MSIHHDIESSGIRQLFRAAELALNDLLTGISASIQEAARQQDFSSITALTKAATAIASFSKTLVAESETLGLFGTETQDRTFLVRISEGALRNSYLSVTEGINRGWLRPGQSIKVTLPDGQQFSSMVMQANRLQERGRVSEFYSTQRIKAGDYVELTEIQPEVWSLATVDVNREGRVMITGERLNEHYEIGAAQARYRENGVWYHPLDQFPGALFDGNGYVLFQTATEYADCDRVKKGPDPNHIHVKGGISSLPSYVRLDPAPLKLKD